MLMTKKNIVEKFGEMGLDASHLSSEGLYMVDCFGNQAKPVVMTNR